MSVKKCSKCQGEKFNVIEEQDCESCEYNGAWDDNKKQYIYDQDVIDELGLVRDEADDSGSCTMGDCFNSGCHRYMCVRCLHEEMWPGIDELKKGELKCV